MRTDAQIGTLMIIDDRGLRGEAFKETERLLKKLDRLEKAVATFYAEDQRLFGDWFELTFRSRRAEIEAVRDEYRKLAEFHNNMLGLARMRDVPLHEAMAILREEEDRYSKGGADERQKIDRERAEREAFIRAAIEEELREEEEWENDLDDMFDDLDEDELEIKEALSERARQISEMRDKKIHQACRDEETAFEFLSATLSSAQNAEGIRLFLRVWELVPKKNQVAFSRIYASQSHMSFDTLLRELREVLEEMKSAEADGEMDGPEPDDFGEDFISTGRRSSAKTTAQGEALEMLKLSYRKLVRKLHPDLQSGLENVAGGAPSWMKKMWHATQAAYQRQDSKELERLYKIVLVRSGELESLTFSEIRQSREWLQAELDRFQHEATGLKRSPAWGFAKRKDFAPLTRRIEKDFDSEYRAVAEELEELQMQHSFLQMLSRQPGGFSRRRRKGKSGGRKKKRNNQHAKHS